jgi:hypothetical protein
MHFLITPRRRLGVAISKQELRDFEPIKGDVQIDERHDAVFGRTTAEASIFNSVARSPDILPPLLDVRITGMGSQGMNLTGVERIGDAFYAQSWWCRL